MSPEASPRPSFEKNEVEQGTKSADQLGQVRGADLPDRLAGLDPYQIAADRWAEQVKRLQQSGELIDSTEIEDEDELEIHFSNLDALYRQIEREVFAELSLAWPPSNTPE